MLSKMLWSIESKYLRTSQDRKSTRLNSSHQIISYAVFCLKKKKDNRTIKVKSLTDRFAETFTEYKIELVRRACEETVLKICGVELVAASCRWIRREVGEPQ